MKVLAVRNSIHGAVILDEHYERLSKFKWKENERRNIQRTEHSQTKFNIHGYPRSIAVSLASEVMQTRGIIYDHIDGNYLNNIPSNLRPCTQAQNCMNKRKTSGRSSMYKGPTWSKAHSRWRTKIQKDGKSIHLGLFDDEILAAIAYDDAAIRLFGEFARLNFPLVMY